MTLFYFVSYIALHIIIGTSIGSGRHFCIHKTAQHLFFIPDSFSSTDLKDQVLVVYLLLLVSVHMSYFLYLCHMLLFMIKVIILYIYFLPFTNSVRSRIFLSYNLLIIYPFCLMLNLSDDNVPSLVGMCPHTSYHRLTDLNLYLLVRQVTLSIPFL